MGGGTLIGFSRKVVHRLFWWALVAASLAVQAVASEGVSPDVARNVTELRAILLEFRATAATLVEGPDKTQILEKIATAQVEVGDLKEAEKTIAALEEASDQGRILRKIAAVQAEAGNLKEAEKTVASITDAHHEVMAWADIWFARAMAGDEAGESLALQNTFQKRDTLMAKDWLKVYQIIRDGMRRLIAAGKISAAQRAAAAVPAWGGQVSPRSQFLYFLAREQLKTGNFTDAKLTLQQLLESVGIVKNQDAWAWALMTIGMDQAEAGDGAGARATFRMAFEAAEAIQDAARAQAAKREIRKAQDEGERKLALALANAGHIHEAVETAAALKPRVVKASLLAKIAEIQAKSGDVFGARQTATILRSEEDKSRALAVVTQVQADSGDILGAFETAALIRGTGRAHALRVIADVQSKTGDRKRALETWGKAAEAAIRDWDFGELTEILESQIEAGDLDGAKRSAAAIPHNSFAQMWLSSAQAQTGDIHGALKRISAIHDPRFKGLGLRNVALVQAKTGNVTSALETAATIEEANVRYEALGWIAHVRAEDGDVRGAIEIATRIEDVTWKAWAFTTIARAQIKAGDRRGALAVLGLAAEAAMVIPGETSDEAIRGYTKGWATFWIARARTKAGDVRGALEIAAINREEDSAGKPWVLPGVAQTQATAARASANMEDMRRALAWANEQGEPDKKIEMIRGALAGLRGKAFSRGFHFTLSTPP